MHRFRGAAVAALLLGVAACDDASGPDGPFDLVVAGDAGLVQAYAGHAISVALLETATGAVVTRGTGTIPASGSDVFRFEFDRILVSGTDYELAVWIDSNDGGGAPGACDGPAIDAQRRVPVSAVDGDVRIELENQVAEGPSSCDAFTVDLAFALAEGFAEPHGGDDIVVRVIDLATGAVRRQELDQIDGSANPPFEQSWEKALVVGRPYEVQVWVDSNVGGGQLGVCDPPVHDHQWRVGLGFTGEENVERVLAYELASMTTVCPIQL